MRDDVREQYAALVTLLSAKRDNLRKLLYTEIDLHHYNKPESIEKLLTLLEDDNSVMDTIDEIDYDIRKHIDSICQLCNIQANDFMEFTISLDDPLSIQLHALYKECKNSISKLLEQRNKLLPKMEQEKQNLDSSIAELQRIHKFKNIKKK